MMDPKEKKQEDEKAEKEYDKGWDEAGKTLEDEEGLPKEEKPAAPEDEEVVLPEENTEAASPSEDKEDPKDKALKDTKSWATKVAMENAELRRTIDDFRRGKATQADVDAQKKTTEETRAGFEQVKGKVYKDYPELQELLDPLFTRVEEMQAKMGSIESDNAKKTEEDRHRAAFDDYSQNVKPEVEKVHPEFEKLLFTKDASGKTVPNEEYFRWAENQRPALKFAAMDSKHPEDIIWAVTEFKKFKASPEAQAHREKITNEKNKKLVNAGTLRGGSTPFPSVSVKDDKGNYDAGWDAAEKQLKEQGVT